jgi:hypothetical protein
MAFRVDLGSEAILHLDDAAAQRVLEQLVAQGLSIDTVDGSGGSSPPAATSPLPDNHPYWNEHSGGPGHTLDNEWESGDQQKAETFYAGVSGKAKVLLDHLIDRPGRLVGAEEIRRLFPDVFASDHSVAGSLNGLRKLKEASGRRYPFYWWKGVPTRYGMKPSVAHLFDAARTRLR